MFCMHYAGIMWVLYCGDLLFCNQIVKYIYAIKSNLNEAHI